VSMRAEHLPARLPRLSPLGFALSIAAAAAVIVSVGQVAPSPGQLVDGGPSLVRLVNRMSPPNLDPDFLARIFWRILETFQIAVAGAAIGIALSLPIGWFAARGVGPLGNLGAFLSKAFVSFLRTVPDLVWALLFVATVGLGAVAGTMTIVVDTIGFCGRFFAEAIEDSDKEPQEAIAAIGGNRLSILFGAVLPDVMPSFINTSLFALEKAVRSSVVLGLVGAGGIGQELKAAFDLFQYRNASTIILVIFLIVLGMEWATDRLRRKVQ
jgi:phosphonate transport system permease protein